jgi:hypothetical protein
MNDRSGSVDLEKAEAVQKSKEVEGDGSAPSSWRIYLPLELIK